MPANLSGTDLAGELRRLPGLIPVSINQTGPPLRWLDLGEYHCYQGFFRDALALHRALLGHDPETFFSGLEILDLTPDPEAHILPTGLIFHAGRCGSTLLVRILARSRKNMVFSEAAAHNQIWPCIHQDNRSSHARYRNLLTTMGRRRLPAYANHLVKFTSWNIVKFSFIRSSLPTPPALFLFREPARLLESYKREVAPWIGTDTGIGNVWTSPEAAVESFFEAALAVRDPRFRVLEYTDLTPGSLPAILKYLGVSVSPAELTQMSLEFLLDAKNLRPQPFQVRAREPGAVPAPQALQNLYEALRERSRTDWAAIHNQ
jgi:hypothetical protein